MYPHPLPVSSNRSNACRRHTAGRRYGSVIISFFLPRSRSLGLAHAVHLPRLLRPFSGRPHATMALTPALRGRAFQTSPRRRRGRIRGPPMRLGASKRTARRIAPIPIFPIAFPCGVERDHLLSDRGDEGHGHLQPWEEVDHVLGFLGFHGQGGCLAGGSPERAGMCVIGEVQG